MMKVILTLIILPINLFILPTPSVNEKMKDKWILTSFFEEVQNTREFWTITKHYPAESHAEIEIQENNVILKGWYEGVAPSYERIISNEIRIGGSYLIEYFPSKDRLLVKYLRNGEI